MSRAVGFLPVRSAAKPSSSRKPVLYAVIVFGLAARWPSSRSVKNACRAGASAVIGGSEAGVEPFGGQFHQLGDGRQIPVGVGRADVAEVGGQGGMWFVDVDA